MIKTIPALPMTHQPGFSNHGLSDFKTKFETVEPEPVFEEEFPDVNEKQGTGVVREVEADTDANGVSEA
ncbi:hypothetical protein EIK77_004686 [Talaromyces pinophilus]|nr:hypothetical protein EIK77_004686 [Talaromyces pinophilus]